MQYRPKYLILFFTTISFKLFGQYGIIGNVIDGDFNEPLPFANVLVKETANGVTTDFDGKYNIELPFKIHKYCQEKFKSKIFSEYLKRKNYFDCCKIS